MPKSVVPEAKTQATFPKLVPETDSQADTAAAGKDTEPAQVVSLDAFRRRSPDP